MTSGIVGRKCGMTRVFNDNGVSTPVTVIEAAPNTVSQIKTMDTDGYEAIQVTVDERKASKVNKAEAGHFAKAQVKAGKKTSEFRIANPSDFTVGDTLTVEQFNEGQFVDTTGISKGKGFAGVIKRHNFKTQDATHGNSLAHRAPGSIGQNQTPGRVFKGKKMAGHMGNKQCTTQSLEVVRVDAERNLLLIKGAVPGAPGSYVVVKPSVKRAGGE